MRDRTNRRSCCLDCDRRCEGRRCRACATRYRRVVAAVLRGDHRAAVAIQRREQGVAYKGEWHLVGGIKRPTHPVTDWSRRLQRGAA